MPRRALIIFPQSTHPVTAGSQVYINYIIRHLVKDLSWDVDFYCPQGMLRRESWEENMDLLSNIYIPKAVAKTDTKHGPIFRLTNVRHALQGGVLHGLVRDFKESMKRLRNRWATKDVLSKEYEILKFQCARPTPAPKLQTPSQPAQSKPMAPPKPVGASPVSCRLKKFEAVHLRESLREIVATNDYDLVMVNYVWMTRPIEWIFDLPRRPVVICNTIDVQYIRESRLEMFREANSFDFDKEKDLELSLLNKYDFLLTITKTDQQELQRELPKKEICPVMVEAAVDPEAMLDEKQYRERIKKAKYDLIFVGADNEANQYAAEALLNKIVPEALKRKPDLKVAIAGKICCNESIGAAAKKLGVELRNHVKSIEEFYLEGRVMAAPIPAGGGVKLKVLEAMAHGIPVVTTPVGAEGIECESGVHCYITHSDQEFVEKALSLLHHPERMTRIALAAQRHIQNTLNSKTVYRDFDRLLDQHFPPNNSAQPRNGSKMEPGQKVLECV